MKIHAKINTLQNINILLFVRSLRKLTLTVTSEKNGNSAAATMRFCSHLHFAGRNGEQSLASMGQQQQEFLR